MFGIGEKKEQLSRSFELFRKNDNVSNLCDFIRFQKLTLILKKKYNGGFYFVCIDDFSTIYVLHLVMKDRLKLIPPTFRKKIFESWVEEAKGAI